MCCVCIDVSLMHCRCTSAVQFFGFWRLQAHAAETDNHQAQVQPSFVSPVLVLQLLWRFNKEAVALRIQYLMNTKEGAESHTVLVTDIPVLEYGTIPHRIETTVFRYLPQRIKVHIGLALHSTNLHSHVWKTIMGCIAATAAPVCCRPNSL